MEFFAPSNAMGVRSQTPRSPEGLSDAPISPSTRSLARIKASAKASVRYAWGCPSVCLLDFGVTSSAIWVVLERCARSLRSWRLEKSPPSTRLSVHNTLLLLELFTCVCQRLAQLHEAGVTHYDVKCDNVLLREGFEAAITRRRQALEKASPDPRSQASQATERVMGLLPFICWTDFGESTFYPGVPAAATAVSFGRGTECVKAPEILVGSSRSETAGGEDPTTFSSGAAADVWSLGCLLYEMLTSKFLFETEDWAKFFFVVTGAGSSHKRFEAETKVSLRLHAAPMPIAEVENETDSTATSIKPSFNTHESGTDTHRGVEAGFTDMTPTLLKLHSWNLLVDGQLKVLMDTVGPVCFGVVVTLLKALLVRDPSQRPTMTQVLEHASTAIAAIATALHEHASTGASS